MTEERRRVLEKALELPLSNERYAVTRDGRRFLILKPVAGNAATPITVVLNWTS